jgi:hypothetical protein
MGGHETPERFVWRGSSAVGDWVLVEDAAPDADGERLVRTDLRLRRDGCDILQTGGVSRVLGPGEGSRADFGGDVGYSYLVARCSAGTAAVVVEDEHGGTHEIATSPVSLASGDRFAVEFFSHRVGPTIEVR